MANDTKSQQALANVGNARSKNWLAQFEEQNALINKGNQDLNDVAIQVFPQGKQQVLLRVENLQDKFDSANTDVKYINLIEFSKDLWLSANQGNATASVPEPVITETTLTGVELVEDAAVSKESLKGKLTQIQSNRGSDDQNGMSGIALDPQSIRTFTVQF